MTTLTEVLHPAEFIVSESHGTRSRAAGTLASGQDLDSGAVIGQISRGVGKADIPTVSGTGNGTMTLLYAGPDVEVGDYLITCTAVVAHGGVFSVVTPGSEVLPSLTLTPGAGGTTAYTSSHINFSVTDGSTDFAEDDVFTITVETGAPSVVGTGNGTISAISMGPETKTGRYRVEMTDTITNGGTGETIAPDGGSLGQGTITAGAGGTLVFVNEQLNFTLTDGSTDFVAGDFFEVVVWNAAGQWTELDTTPTAYDGRENAAGILYAPVDASLAAAACVVLVRDAEVDSAQLDWPTAATAGEKTVSLADLAAIGIIAR